MTKDLVIIISYYKSNCGIDITFSGSTCVTVLVSGTNLWCANIGDSRAVSILSVFNRFSLGNLTLANGQLLNYPMIINLICLQKKKESSKAKVESNHS